MSPSTFQRVTTRVRRAAVALLLASLGACSKHETQTITSWLRVDVATPRADELIRVGSKREVYEIKRNGRWKKFGVGNSSSYMVLGEETAVLVQLNDGKGLQLVRPNEPPQPVPASFGRMGTVHVAGASLIDVVANDTPREASVYRHDLSGTLVAQFRLVVPEAYSDCRVAEGLLAYGKDFVPYGSADCKMGSQQAKCLIVGPNGFVHAVPPEADWSECGSFGKVGISTTEPARFTVF
ncbi:MAG TPA: hypothetical protein VGF48_24370 [Thermoanaerobaculia bacterium]|jgi:hypothetical protein